MNKGSYIAVIVEGADRERMILGNLINNYFKKERCKIITFPAEQNIYMLWKRMEEDEFQTDLIEVVREYSKDAAKILVGLTRNDFSDVFLFFDYDGHQNNLPSGEDGEEVLLRMLAAFDNETENGRLYVSYPMVEALRDYVPAQCRPFTVCVWNQSNLGEYKNKTGTDNLKCDIKGYRFEEWADIINVFALCVSCLFGYDSAMDFEQYRREVEPAKVYESQQKYIKKEQIFVLSAFPEFLLDYYKIDFWKRHVKLTRLCDVCQDRI